MAERTATSRLSRLLALVPYILAHQGVTFAEAARAFGITESQLKDDLNLIFVSGLPGYTPLELIDVVMDHDSIYIRNADVIAKPMRLHPDEALSLLVGLELLEGLTEVDVSTLKVKISEASTARVAEIAERFSVAGERSEIGGLVHDALNKGRRLLLDYYVPNRDEVTTREIDPISIAVIEGHTYLVGYCRLAESRRHFRIDRILSAKIVDRPSAPPPDQNSGRALFENLARAGETVTIEVEPAARWLVDHLGATVLTQEPLTISAGMADPEFFVRLGLSMAATITIKEPQWIREKIAEAAQQAL